MIAYAGPIVDPHIHLWDVSQRRHPWLLPGDASIGGLGDLAPMRRDRLPRDYLDEAAGHGVTATVHIEAAWDPSCPIEETRWLAGLDKPRGVAKRFVVFAKLDAANVEAQLDAHLAAGAGTVAGVRSRLSWHPNPAKRFAERADLMDDPAWRDGLRALVRRGLHLEVMIYPQQAEQLARVAGAMPALGIVVNHCASPVDRDAEGVARWRRALSILSGMANISLKISNVGAYIPRAAAIEVEAVVMRCVEAFGPARCMFASDWPVVTLHTPLARVLDDFRAAARRFTISEQKALFHDTAARLYRLPVQD